MAPKVNRLTPEVGLRDGPSRRLETELLWRSAHNGGPRRAAWRAAPITDEGCKGEFMTNRRVPLRQGVALVFAISGGIAADSGWAQQAANPPALTEIIVTAQKREQNIQDVPISVIALSAQQLKDGGVTDIKNLQSLTPGLTVTSTTSENVTTARIRGIGTVGDNPGLESSVGVVIDGVYRPRNG